ncbi:MAG: hypothetical protein AAB401_24900 [Acidobacteriota bacterium]
MKDDTIFAGTGGGVFRSTNNGQSWVPINNGLLITGIRSLAIGETHIFAGINGAGIFSSNDNGQNWTSVNNGPTGLSNGQLLATGNILYAITGNGLFLSTDNGQTWTPLKNDLLGRNVTALATRGEFLYAASSGGVFLSTNNGKNWTPINNGLFSKDITSLVVGGNYVFAGTFDDGVFRGSDFVSSASTVSAASFGGQSLAPESVATVFGLGFSTNTQVAGGVPLPTSLAGTSLTVRDSAGVERFCLLFFVSPNQINFQIPPGTAAGAATATIASSDAGIAISPLQISAVAPGLFTANANGQGVPAAVVLRIKANGQQVYEPLSRFDSTQNKFVPLPIDLGQPGDQVYLLLYGTGVRNRSSLSAVTVSIGGLDVQVIYAGVQPDFIGLDQINVRLPTELAGRGEVTISLRVDGIAANPVQLNIK